MQVLWETEPQHRPKHNFWKIYRNLGMVATLLDLIFVIRWCMHLIGATGLLILEIWDRSNILRTIEVFQPCSHG